MSTAWIPPPQTPPKRDAVARTLGGCRSAAPVALPVPRGAPFTPPATPFPVPAAYAILATMQASAPDSGPHEADAQMPNRPDSASAARAFLARLLDGWGLSEQVIDDAAMLTGELMANAVQHGSGVVTLRIEANNGRLHVGVHDDEEAVP